MISTAPQYAEKTEKYFGNPRTDIEGLLPDNASRVLEIGCGSGATMQWLRTIRQIKYATGIELVSEIADKAALVFDQIMVGAVKSLVEELPHQSYDLILALDVLEHLVDPWDVVQACSRRLRPGGIMIASIPNVGHYTVALPLAFRGKWNYAREGLLDRTHLRFFVAQTAIDLMKSSGLAIERVERVRVVPPLLSRLPVWLGGPRLRWYVLKFMDSLPGWHLIDFRYIISARAPAEG